MFLLILARGVHVNEYIFNRTNHVILDCLMKNSHLELLNQQICKIKNEIKLHFLVCSYVTFAVTPIRALVGAFEFLLSIPLWVTSQPSI